MSLLRRSIRSKPDRLYHCPVAFSMESMGCDQFSQRAAGEPRAGVSGVLVPASQPLSSSRICLSDASHHQTLFETSSVLPLIHFSRVVDPGPTAVWSHRCFGASRLVLWFWSSGFYTPLPSH